jgi:hypothetical protein
LLISTGKGRAESSTSSSSIQDHLRDAHADRRGFFAYNPGFLGGVQAAFVMVGSDFYGGRVRRPSPAETKNVTTH